MKTISKLSLFMLLVTMFTLVASSQTSPLPNIGTDITYTWTPVTDQQTGEKGMLFSIETGNKLVTLFGVKVIWQYEVGGAISVNRAYDKSNGDKPTSIVVWLTTGEKGAMEFPLIIVGVVGYEVRESKQDVVRY